MIRFAFVGLLCFSLNALAQSAAPAPAKKPVLKITPGQVIVPTDAMRRPWGELISLDPATRTGAFRNEGDDTVMRFTIMPYAELLHHAAFGDVQDFRVGERAIFRLHTNDLGEWVWLTYIQDEMNMLNGHKEYYFVEKLDAATGRIQFTQANADKSFIRSTNVVMETDAKTRFWKAGEPAKFTDIKVGDGLRAKTHGTGQGKTRVAWEVFLDDSSLLKFQTEQKAVHAKRMAEQGLPGYVDASESGQLKLTLFHEAGEWARALKKGQKVQVAPAAVDRRPVAEPGNATVTEAKMAGNLGKVTLALEGPTAGFKPAGLVRVWVGK
jgi:hypothetical protein